jgi:hypothetical protein
MSDPTLTREVGIWATSVAIVAGALAVVLLLLAVKR